MEGQDRFGLADRAADRLLRDGLAQLAEPGHSGVRTFPVRHDETATSLIANLVPIRRSARDLFARCDVAFEFSRPSAEISPVPIELLQTLFDLTPAKSRIARGLVEGEAVERIAGEAGVSRNTVATHLRSAWEAGGAERQAESSSAC